MFHYLGEKILVSDTDTDVYRCEFWFIFCTMCVCSVLFPTDVTAVKRVNDVSVLLSLNSNPNHNTHLSSSAYGCEHDLANSRLQ